MNEDCKNILKAALDCHKNGDLDNAEKLYAQVLNKTPDNPDLLNLYGLLKYQKKDYVSAIMMIKAAAEKAPNAYYYDNLGRVYTDCENYIDAISAFKAALKLEPENFGVWFNLARVFNKNKQVKSSLKAYRKALSLNPESAEIYFNLGTIFEFMDKTEISINCYKRALKYAPNDIETNYFLAVSYLKLKDFKRGWPAFECRPSRALSILTQNKMHTNLLNDSNAWIGQDLRDKTLFIPYEAGLGDTIMFARYIPLLEKYCAKIIFEPQEALRTLFQENFKNVEVVSPDKYGDELKFDYFATIMSLAYLTQNMVNGIPYPKGYLHPNSELVNLFKEKYFNNNSFKIGIKWEGNSEVGLNRIIPVSAFAPLADLPNVKLYSLQKGAGEDDLKNCNFEIVNLSPEFDDFSKTTAAIENLDLVICNDTSVAHLAGAIAKDCWILLPRAYNWRWHDDLSYSPWYSSVKLFRQENEDDWSSVMQKVASEVAGLISKKN